MTELSRLLWENNTGSGKAVILLIIGLGIAGCLCALWHASRYRGTERNWLETVRGRMQRAQAARALSSSDTPSTDENAAETAPARPSASPLIELHELSEGIPPQTLIGDRLRTIAQMRQARARVNVDALQQSTMLKESASWSISFPAYVVGLVMMLGLLGTFIGLSMMVVDIQQALPGTRTDANAAQWASSVSSLGRILAGKKTAFSATLVGLCFSIIVSTLNFAMARAQSHFHDLMERFTSEELLPATVPAFDDETPWEKLSTQLGDSFEQLKSLASEQTRSAEQMAAVEKAFATMIENIETITRRAATAPLQGMAGEITNVIGALTHVNTAVIGLTDKLPQVLNAFRQTHQSTLTQITSAMQTQQATLDRVSHAIHSDPWMRFGRIGFAAAGAAVVLVVVFVMTRIV